MKIALWVRTADSACFPFTSMPAYTVLPMVPCLFHLRTWTFVLALICTIAIWRMKAKGRDLPWIYNRLRGRLCGNRISARPIWHIRRFCSTRDLTAERRK